MFAIYRALLLLAVVVSSSILKISNCDGTAAFSTKVLTELEEEINRKYYQNIRARRQTKPALCHVETVVVKLAELEIYRNKLPVPSELKVSYCIGACLPTFAHDQRSQIIIRLAAGNGVGCVPSIDTNHPPANETILSFDSVSGTFNKVVIQNFYINSCKCIA